MTCTKRVNCRCIVCNTHSHTFCTCAADRSLNLGWVDVVMSGRHRRMSGTAEVVSWSRDSISVRWTFHTDNPESSGGYKVRYQAVGSNVVQVSRLLDISASAYDITQLHENTSYDICVLRMRQLVTSGADGRQSSTWLTEASACVRGTTSTDSRLNVRSIVGDTTNQF